MRPGIPQLALGVGGIALVFVLGIAFERTSQTRSEARDAALAGIAESRCEEWAEAVEWGDRRLTPEQEEAVRAFKIKIGWPASTDCETAAFLDLVGTDGSLSPLALRILGYCAGRESAFGRHLPPLPPSVFDELEKEARRSEAEVERWLEQGIRRRSGEEGVRAWRRQEEQRARTCRQIDDAIGPGTAIWQESAK
jgi:hypothetical protein